MAMELDLARAAVETVVRQLAAVSKTNQVGLASSLLTLHYMHPCSQPWLLTLVVSAHAAVGKHHITSITCLLSVAADLLEMLTLLVLLLLCLPAVPASGAQELSAATSAAAAHV